MAFRFRQHWRILVAIAAIMTAFACAGPGRFLETPHISLTKIHIKKIGLLEQVYQVDLRVLNPNSVPLAVKGLDCTLTVNNKQFARGVSTTEATIPALGTGTIPITLYASLPDVIKTLKILYQGDTLKYRVAGKLLTGGGLFLPSSIPYETEGVFSLEEDKKEDRPVY